LAISRQLAIWQEVVEMRKNNKPFVASMYGRLNNSDAGAMSIICNNSKTVNFLETGAFDGNKYKQGNFNQW